MDIVNFGVAADGHFGLNSLSARVTATSGVDNLSVISVDGEVIGQVADYSDQWTLGFEFNDKATPERVSELLHALTFVNSSTDANAMEPIAGSRSRLAVRTIPLRRRIFTLRRLRMTPQFSHGGN